MAAMASGRPADGDSPAPAGGGTPPSLIADSDSAFLLKLLGLCVFGGAAIKYGSLLLDLPFEPNSAIAVTAVVLPPAVYSLILLSK